MALVIDIADAIVAELSDGVFSQAILPVRRVLPQYELADLKDIRVTVVPASIEIEAVSRSVSQYDARIDIGIQKKLGKALDVEVADLCSLVEEISNFLKHRPLKALPLAVWIKSSNEPIYAVEHILEQRSFTSVLSIIYRVLR